MGLPHYSERVSKILYITMREKKLTQSFDKQISLSYNDCVGTVPFRFCSGEPMSNKTLTREEILACDFEFIEQLAQTLPPMWHWNHEQKMTVKMAIGALVGRTFICNHPNMQGVETTVVEQHPHSAGVTLFLHSPSRADESVINHECDIWHFVEFYTPVP